MAHSKNSPLAPNCKWVIRIVYTSKGSKEIKGLTLECNNDRALDAVLLALLPYNGEGSQRTARNEVVRKLATGINVSKVFNDKSVAIDNIGTLFDTLLDDNVERIIGITADDVGEILLGAPFFSETAVEKNITEILQNLEKRVDASTLHKNSRFTTPDGDNLETEEEVKGSIGTTKFCSILGNKRDYTKGMKPPFDANEWVQKSTDAMLAQEKALPEVNRRSREEIEACFKKEAASWGVLTDIGTAIHAVFEYTMGGIPIPPEAVALLSKSQLEKTIKQAENLKACIKKQYPDCTIMTEVKIMSKQLAPELLDALHQKDPDCDNINGRIDLLVIDKNKNAHIYDYKVSRKEVGRWDIQDNSVLADNFYWTSAKKFDATNQLAIYAQILKQYGVRVQDCNIIPLKITPIYDDAGLVLGEYDKPKKGLNGKTLETGYNITGLKSFDSTFNPEVGLVDGQNLYKIPKTLEGDIYRHVSRMLPADLDIKGLDLDKPYEQFRKIFPSSKIGGQVNIAKHSSRDVDYYIDNKKNWAIVQDDSTGKTQYRYYNGKTHIYCDTMEELRDVIGEDLRLKEDVHSQELLNIASSLRTALKSGKIEDYTSGFDNSGKVLLSSTFDKYIQNQWELVSDDMLLAAGIFLFKKDDRIEVQVFTNMAIGQIWPGSFGKTILGERRSDEQCTDVMEATTAHLEGLKALTILANNPNLLQGVKIRTISIINPWRSESVDTVFNKTWVDNYNKLRMYFKDVDLPALNNGYFLNTERALLELAKEKLQDIQQTKNIDLFNIQYDVNKVAISSEWISNILRQLGAIGTQIGKPVYNLNQFRDGDPFYEAYGYLLQLYMHLNGVDFINESDKEKWFNGLIPEGTYVNSANFSTSKNLRTYGDLHARYEREIRDKATEPIHKIQQAVRKLEDMTGKNGRDLWWMFIEKGPDGKISKDFRFISPEKFSGPKEAKAILSNILDILWHAKKPNVTEAETNAAKENGEYYEIPLLKAATVQRVFKRNNGFSQSLKEWWRDDVKTTVKALTEEDVAAREIWKKEGNYGVFNPLNITGTERRRRLEEHGVDFYEQNLEPLFYTAIIQGVKTTVSEKYGILFNAMKFMMRRSNTHNGVSMKNVEETLDKLIENRFYGNAVMENAHLHQALAPVMSAFSTLRIGGNVKGFLREMLSGTYAGMTRAGAKLLSGLDADNYVKAVEYILEDLPNNPSGISIVQQLNRTYGMANWDLYNAANASTVNWLKPNKWSKNTLFLNTTAPDYQHRMAILIGKMMGDGCWDAHKMNKDGILEYDMFKDKRFSVFLSGKTEHKDYLKQKALYYTYLKEWSEFKTFSEDDKDEKTGLIKLPQAYTPKEASSIKNFGDLLYGHYDGSSKSLLDDTFLGSFFMQFKTYATAKFEQWFLKGDTYNIGQYKEVRDPDTGELVYEKVVIGDSTTDLPGVERILESQWKQLSEKERAEYQVAMEWSGEPMEGIFWVACHFVKALFTNPSELQKMWEDPRKRAILQLGVYDLIILGIIEFLVCLLFGAAKGKETYTTSDVRTALRKEGGYLESLGFNILTGACDDHNIFSTLINMTDISILSLTQSYTRNTMNLLAGNQNAVSYITKSIGPLSELQGLAAQLSAE